MPQQDLQVPETAIRHRLQPLLAPRSIALVGASPRPGTVGGTMLAVLRDGGYGGRIDLVNPNYQEIAGLPCRPALDVLETPPDLAVLALAGERLEAALEAAIDGGAGAALIFDSCYQREETRPSLLARLRRNAADARFPVLGGNAMGFYNFERATHVSFQAAPERPPGGVALIAHSGSVFVACVANDPRHRFNLAVSAGQEIGARVDDYMDYALDLPSTRVLALFIETVRDPSGFVAALEKARARDVPVVVAKVGRSEAGARFAATHSGAIAGDDAAYEALFAHYGVVRVDSLDELLAAAQLLAQPQRPGPGGLGYIGDSGGLRELLVDRAEALKVPLARFSARTRERLADVLPRGLEPDNPLDAAGPFSPDFAAVFEACLPHLLGDPDVAVGVFEFEARDDFTYMPAFVEQAKAARHLTEKPFIVLNCLAGANNTGLAVELLDAGVPLISGLDQALVAVRGLLAYRDFLARPSDPAPASPEADKVAAWAAKLAGCDGAASEAEGLALAADFGIPVARTLAAASEDQVRAAAAKLGYPLALKTAAPGIHHKTEAGGVALGLADEAALLAAYRDMAARLGPEAVLSPMVAGAKDPSWTELAFGMITDPQFGPLVMVGAGGTLVELLSDRRLAIPPFGPGQARCMIEGLRLAPLLTGHRGAPAADFEGLAMALARFSVLAASLRDVVAEIDLNPVIATDRGPVAVDALVLPARVPASKDPAAD